MCLFYSLASAFYCLAIAWFQLSTFNFLLSHFYMKRAITDRPYVAGANNSLTPHAALLTNSTVGLQKPRGGR